MNSSINILSESLSKKIDILRKIQIFNEKQREIFTSDNVNMDLFDNAIAEKDVLIEQLIKLDDGFEILYNDVAEELKANRFQYSSDIKEMQYKISVITELSMTVQAEEKRNKKLIEDYFSKQRQSIGKGRNSSRAAYGYYKSYTGGDVNTSFFDEKH